MAATVNTVKSALDSRTQELSKPLEDAASTGSQRLQESVEDARKRLSEIINTGVADVEKGIGDANTSITKLAPEIERIKLDAKLVDQISHVGELQMRVDNLEQRMRNQEQITLTQSHLTRDQWKQIQRNLAALHFNPGPIDGWYGSRTASAIREYQKQRSEHPDVTGTLTGAQAADLLNMTLPTKSPSR
jgi:hypothetical protein